MKGLKIYMCQQAGGSRGNSSKGTNFGYHNSKECDVSVNGKLLEWGYNVEILSEFRQPIGWEIAFINVPEGTPIDDPTIIDQMAFYRNKYNQAVIDYSILKKVSY